jgi:8-oxo-dGTP pyrophosphatase MutT (NUDIX family)
MHNAMLDAVARHLPADGMILAPGWSAERLGVAAERLRDDGLADLRPAAWAAVIIVDDQLSHAGVHAEEMVDRLGAALEPDGVLVASLRNRIFASAVGDRLDGVRGFSSSEAAAMLHHRGFTIDVMCAPGAAARLRGADDFDLEADRRPGLLDAAPRLLTICRAPRTAEERARTFFETRARKITAAGTVCRDPDGRLLVVYDRFRRMWTIPGGVIDEDEDPASAAQRETWEESGIEVEVGQVLGVFAGRWPDRVIFVFAAKPTMTIEHPEPVHPHEIADVVWLPLDEALQRLAPEAAFRVTRCLDQPGYSWAPDARPPIWGARRP